MTGPRRTSRRLLAVSLISGIAALIGAAPAGAYLRDFQSISVLTAANSQSPKFLIFTCPTAKTAIGTGASIPLISNLGIDRMYVAFGQKAVYDGAAETDSVAAPWSLTDRAFCATSTATKPNVGGAGAYVKKVVMERNQSSTNSNFTRSVIAQCPADSPTVIGGGGVIDGATSDVALESVQRLANGTQLRIKAHEVDSTNAAWSLESHAICADVTNPVNAPVYVDAILPPEAHTAFNSLNKTLTVPCPAGKVIVGGGAHVYGAAPRTTPPPPDVVIKESRPAGDASPATAWTGSAVETDPIAASWTLEVRAVCATPNAPFS